VSKCEFRVQFERPLVVLAGKVHVLRREAFNVELALNVNLEEPSGAAVLCLGFAARKSG